MSRSVKVEQDLNIEYKRFKSLDEIKKYLQEIYKDAKIDIVFKNHEDEDFSSSDYEIMASVQGKDYLYDIDLYFLYDRKRTMLITEVNVEAQ